MLRPFYHTLQRLNPFDGHSHRHHHFLAAWVRSPLKMGALVPSSRRLARAMAAEVDLHKAGTIVELGAGTGVVTHALLNAGIPSDRLLIVERDKKLHHVMTSQFPHLTIACADAIDLNRVLIDNGITRVNAIVSSLPLLSMPKGVRRAIEQQMAICLGHDGTLIQFTYGPRAPISRQQARQYRLKGKRTKLVIANVPPAHLWVYKRD